jgi:hypothetical protein
VPLDPHPPVTLGAFHGADTTIALMRQLCVGPRGERSTLVRHQTEEVVRQLQPKAYDSEILAIRDWCATHLRYVNDPIATEWVKDPERMVQEIRATGKSTCDCDEIALLIATMARQLGREVEWVTVGFGSGWQHVFARVKEPKSGKWIICDPVAGTNEAKMLGRVRQWKTWRID